MYKACIKAWKREKGEESLIGDTYRIHATLRGARDGMDILNVMNDLRCFSSNTNVATVSG